MRACTALSPPGATGLRRRAARLWGGLSQKAAGTHRTADVHMHEGTDGRTDGTATLMLSTGRVHGG